MERGGDRVTSMSSGLRDVVEFLITLLIAVAFIALLHAVTDGDFVLWRAVVVSAVILGAAALFRAWRRQR
jgi:hypothetical protein